MIYVFSEYPRIMVDPEICFGKPCIKGTRITVASLLAYISGGMTIDELIKEFNWISKEDILQAVSFAASMVDNRIIPLNKVS